MRKLSLNIFLLACLLAAGDALSECTQSTELFDQIPDREAEKFASRMFREKDNGVFTPEFVLLFYALPDLPSEGSYLFRADWKLFENNGNSSYCPIGKGNTFQMTRSWHHIEVDEFYGVPGSGRRRCEPPDSYLKAPALRSASVELGDSYVFHLSHTDENDDSTEKFIVLASKLLDGWILLEYTGNRQRCYRSRGPRFDVISESEFKKKISGG